MKFIFIIPIVFVFLFCVESVRACSCVRQEVCQFYSNARVVFSGEVLETFEKTKNVKHREMRIGSGKWEENTYVEKRQVSRIRIEESFTGTGDKKELFIETEIGSSCALPLQKGVRYLIYASHVENEENLMTYFCSGTKPVSSAQEDLSYLRANKKNSGATVSG